MRISTTEGAIDLSWVAETPELDDLQAGTLRMIINRSRQLPGDWSGMLGGSGGRQEDFGALRFQLANMSDALAVVHAFRMPAAPAVFREPFDALIQKMLHTDCWFYWRDLSRGGHILNKSLGKMESEWDPVVRDNIMYSAYIQTMPLLYHYLFNDAKYTEPGSLNFGYSSLFWEANESHPYDENSLNDHLYWQMVQNGYLGIACEPNCVFAICNQPPIIGFRMHDLLNGGDTAGEVSRGFLKAWDEFGGLNNDDSGGYKTLILEKERSVVNLPTPSLDFWLASLLHAWHPEEVERMYPSLLEKWVVDGPDGTLYVEAFDPFAALDEVLDQTSGGAARATGPAASNRITALAQHTAWATVAASEVGDTETLNKLLAYADRFMNGTWEDGGYYYKRRDDVYDADGIFVNMDPMSGNALLPFARLNVPNGRRRLYEGAWNERHFDEPAVVSMTRDLDLRRAWFDSDRNALALTLAAPVEARRVRLQIGNVADRSTPQLWRDGLLATDALSTEADHLVISVDHDARTDLVLTW